VGQSGIYEWKNGNVIHVKRLRWNKKMLYCCQSKRARIKENLNGDLSLCRAKDAYTTDSGRSIDQFSVKNCYTLRI